MFVPYKHGSTPFPFYCSCIYFFCPYIYRLAPFIFPAPFFSSLPIRKSSTISSRSLLRFFFHHHLNAPLSLANKQIVAFFISCSLKPLFVTVLLYLSTIPAGPLQLHNTLLSPPAASHVPLRRLHPFPPLFLPRTHPAPTKTHASPPAPPRASVGRASSCLPPP